MAPTADMRAAFQRRPSFHRVYKPFKGIAKEYAKDGKNVFLWQNLEKEIGEIVPHWQGPDPETGNPGEGDCVGQASAMGSDVLAATDIHDLKQNEKWLAKASVEMVYAGSRIEVGRRDSNGTNYLRGRGGSHGEWAAKFLKEWGVLHRVKYERDGQVLDLSGYDPGRSREYRDAGVPDWLEPIAKEHPVQEYTNPRSGTEALDAVCARHPVIMCSSWAFHSERDAQGFCAPYTGSNQRRGWRTFDIRVQWWHAMVLTGALLEGGRIGGLIQNSHGDWNDGPRPFGIPRGSFFADLEVLDWMVKDWYDCWALGSYKGHEAARIRRTHKLWR